MKHIKDIAYKINLKEEDLEYYGKYKAKIKPLNNQKKGKLILVTAINPTPFGEGKTTVSIGLGDALNLLGKKTIITLREPSLGPVFGIKGGATGGGLSTVEPSDDINLHFTGDFHAITSANNLLASAIDNNIKQGNDLNIDIKKIVFNRCLDLNDRSLREIVYNINENKRYEKFNITASSEIMAILCLAKDINDLEDKINNIIIAYTKEDKPLYAKDLKISKAIVALLKDAINPNLVQTKEENPVIIHGGPFANIAHGCNSIIATNTALSLADYTITEAGFGSDLGALKFLDIKSRNMNIYPNLVVLVVTIKALKYNGNVKKEDILKENIEALKKGISNLEAHIDNLKYLGSNIIVCLNKFNTDIKKEIEFVKEFCLSKNIKCEVSESYSKGSKGALNLANLVLNSINNPSNYKLLYDINDSIEDKINAIVKKIYKANEVIYSKKAKNKIKLLKKLKLDKKLICISKTQYSISDNPKIFGNPNNYSITVSDINLYNGAGFITVLMGDVFTMPGLSKEPSYQNIYVKDDKIEGIF